MTRVTPDSLNLFCRKILGQVGADSAAAVQVADHLVGANLAGHDSHGVLRLPQYYSDAKSGRLHPGKTPIVEHETASTARIDGDRTWGQVVANCAIDLAIDKAKSTAVGAVTVRRCYHVGRVGVYAQRAAEAGFIVKIWCNGHGAARVAPWGGVEARLATNPIAIAVPTRTAPILVDVTTSVVAEGKVRLAKNKGEAIPEGWILDKHGRPSCNPADLYDGGTLLPMGGQVGHKGFGLGMIVDLLGGVLSGAGCGLMPGVGVGNGMLIEVLDPTAFAPRDEFLRRIDEYLAYLRSSRPKPGVESIVFPGQPERAVEARRRQEGLYLDDGTVRQLESLARELGVSAADLFTS